MFSNDAYIQEALSLWPVMEIYELIHKTLFSKGLSIFSNNNLIGQSEDHNESLFDHPFCFLELAYSE